MAHFARIIGGKVVSVISLNNEDILDLEFPESEEKGKDLIESLGLLGEWVQTSYNKNFRGQFAGIGMEWNGQVFHAPQPFPSWTLDSDGLWNAPVSYPDDGQAYSWDEEDLAWVLAEA